jgi:hypothetical protein
VIFRTNCSTVANIDNVKVIIKCHDEVAATARLAVLHFLCGLVLGKYPIDIVFVCHH